MRIVKEPVRKKMDKQDVKDLKTLARDFGLLHKEEVQKILETCKDYADGQRKIMQVYEMVYLK